MLLSGSTKFPLKLWKHASKLLYRRSQWDGIHSARYASNSGAYYVLLPEIPPDTPETNPIMRTESLPKYSDISPDLTVTGCAKLAIEYETQLGDLLEKLRDPKYKKSFESVFHPIERITVPINFAWRTAKNLNYVKGTKGFRQAFQRIHPQVERAKNERWISEALNNAVKEVNADADLLDEYQQRLVAMYLIEGRLNGIELAGNQKKRFIDTLRKLTEAKNHFRNRVMICSNLFNHTIDDFSILSECTKQFLTQIAVDRTNPSRGPWKVTLQPAVYQHFLEYCSDRLTRWNVWNAFNNRAALTHNDQNLANHKAIEEIRTHRRDIAKLLGYENFAEMSMETKMAGKVENVLSMIEGLKGKFYDAAVDEVSELQDFAKSEGCQDPIRVWDLPYWRRRQRDHLYKLDDMIVAQYFQFSTVLDGLFSLVNQLFSITIKDCTSEVESWDKDVKFYKIFDENGQYLSGFYLDPYTRSKEKIMGTWMESGRENSQLCGTSPLSYWNLNLPRPMGDQPTLITFSNVHSIFHEFGHGLQQLLTTVPYSELSGQRNVEWDALQTSSTLMENMLTKPHIVKMMSKHYSTGETIPDGLIDTIYKAKKHMSSFDMMRQLYFSAYDMEVYISNDHWNDIMQRVWKEFMPLPLEKEDNHPCSLTHIFSDQYPAAYYSYKWSEMISADCFKAFEEVGWQNKDKIAAVGKRYRDTFLSLGGAIPASEVFRRFRGRDPSVDALVHKYLNDV